MRFVDVTGHQSVKERLIRMVEEDRLPHALLISAPEGSGEMMLARALAQFIHCTGRQPEDTDSCGQCPSCRLHQSLNHADLHFVFPVLKKKSQTDTICDDWLSDWREFISSDPWMDFRRWQASLGNPNGQPKIYVHDAEALRRKMSLSARTSDVNIALIWMPEKMQPETANKLLKLIEEPEPGSMFILVSNSPAEVLPTIYSRCQRIELRRLSDAEVAAVIAGGAIPDANQTATAHLSEGNVIAARDEAADARSNALFLDLFMQLMRLAYASKIGELKKWSETVADLGRETECRFMEYCQRMVRENFIYNLKIKELNYMTSAEQQFSERFCPFINERNVEGMITEFNEAKTDVQGNGNGKIIMFDLAIKIILLLKK